MASQTEIDNRFLAQRFDDWTTDWTLPWLFWALLNLDPAFAWGSSIVVAVVAGELRWFVYPRAIWPNALFDMLLTIGQWAYGLWTASKLRQADRDGEAVACIAILAFLRVVYCIIVMLISDRRRMRKYRTHYHNVFFYRFYGRPFRTWNDIR
jgi:hypothetical protein